MDASLAPAALRNSAGPSPARPPASVRRTSTIDTTWPDGRGGPMRMVGAARDAVTPADGGPLQVCVLDGFRAVLQGDRTIIEIESMPPRAAMGGLVGARGGGHLRKVLGELLPSERDTASPLFLILDDIAGASLVAGWAWSRWTSEWRTLPAAPGAPRPVGRRMEGICSGFRPGSSALAADGSSSADQSFCDVGDLRRPDDPEGWHEFTVQAGVGMRRARRIDVWVDDAIRIDSAFQDSATNPQGGRTAVHEYRLTATADPVSLRLLSVEADPRVLPYAECPGAAPNVARLVGQPLASLREAVLKTLPGTLGCTHLNDALRALAEVPALVARLADARRGDATAAIGMAL
jgi:hypothetical protein